MRTTLHYFIDRQMLLGDLVAIVRTSAGMGALQLVNPAKSDRRALVPGLLRRGRTAGGAGGAGGATEGGLTVLSPEQSVAEVAEAGEDELAVVQLAVEAAV